MSAEGPSARFGLAYVSKSVARVIVPACVEDDSRKLGYTRLSRNLHEARTDEDYSTIQAWSYSLPRLAIVPASTNAA